jgi:hypothetical protein
MRVVGAGRVFPAFRLFLRRRSAWRTGAAVLAITLGWLALLEGVSRVVEYVVEPIPVDSGLGYTEESRVFVPDPMAPGYLMTNPAKTLSFHEQRFRLAKEPNERRIFMLGGSCVMFLQDENGGPLYSRLEKALNLSIKDNTFPGFPGPGLSLLRGMLDHHFGGQYRCEIINCGAGAYGSTRLVLVLAEVLNYAPDLILYYEGHNEFEEVEQMKYVPVRTLGLQAFLGRFAVYRLIRAHMTTRHTLEIIGSGKRQSQDQPFPAFITATSCDAQSGENSITERMIAMESNLEIMAGLCREKKVPLILSTVPSNLKEPQTICKEDLPRYEPVFRLFEEGKYDEARQLGEEVMAQIFHRQATEAENTVLRQVAGRNHLPLADVKAAIIAAEPNHFPGETLFWDDCHLYPEGNRILLDTFFETILEHIDFAPQPARLTTPSRR